MKILNTGIVASGKTTLARRLSRELHIPWYELDGIVHPASNGRRKFKSFLIQYRHKLTEIRNIDKMNWHETLKSRKS